MEILPRYEGRGGLLLPLFLLYLVIITFFAACSRASGTSTGATPPPLASERFHHFKDLLNLSLGDLGAHTSLVLKPGSSGTEGWVGYLVKGEGGRGGEVKILHFYLNPEGETEFEILNVGAGFAPSFRLLRHPNTGELLLVVAGDQGGLYLYRQEGREWRQFILEEGIQVLFLDAVLDVNGGVHVAYVEAINKDLRYLLWQDEALIFRPVLVDTGYEEGQAIPGGQIDKKVSLDLNLNNEPIISYYDASSGFLRLARFQGGTNSWNIRAVGEAVTQEVLRPDANGEVTTRRPFFAIPSQVKVYKNFSPLPPTGFVLLGRQSLRILNYDPRAEYEMDYIAPAADSQNYGQWSSLKVRPDGAVEISYYDFFRGFLGFATNLNPEGGDAWSFSVVDSGGMVGDMNTLAYAPLLRQGVQIGVYPVVAYYDGSNANLNFAYRYKGQWNVTLLDSLGFAGLFPSLAVSEDGWVVVAYLVTDPITLITSLRVLRFVPFEP